jgi:hypothetical protein
MNEPDANHGGAAVQNCAAVSLVRKNKAAGDSKHETRKTSFVVLLDFYNFNLLILQTPKIASLKIPVLIFDVPNSLSINVIGTSTILKPCFFAAYFIQI